MIAKLNFVSVTGPKEELDRFVDEYMSKRDIHLEHAVSELKTVNTLHPFVYKNPYKEYLPKCEELAKEVDLDKNLSREMGVEEAIYLIDDLYKDFQKQKKDISGLLAQTYSLKERLNKVKCFGDLNFDIESILGFKALKCRFGRISKVYYSKFLDYAEENDESIFVKSSEDKEFVWGIYFVSNVKKESVDAAYTSLHFERINLPENMEGTPKEECEKLNASICELEAKIQEIKDEYSKKLNENKDNLKAAYDRINRCAVNYEIRKYAAYTDDNHVSYFFLCGWMEEKDALEFFAEIKEKERDIICIVDKKHEMADSKPPTKLNNPRLFKPFEMFIRMYGLPAYNEIDPTIFVALTYAFIFGAMFGDVGQGLCLVVGGFLLYKFKKMNLAEIIACAGVFSTFFGFMFGSVFGYEGVFFEPIWLSPSHAMSTIPFIGRLNTVFIVAIAFGMGLNILTMVLHIINAVRAKDKEGLLFDANGVAGIVFYGALAIVLVLYMSGNKLPSGIVLAIMFVIPLILLALKEPLMNIIEKKAEIMPKEKGMFVAQTFFEMFEILLSYFSNTLSFVRVGAFAVSHAAMMEVVLMLAGVENGGGGNLFIIVIGNIFVCGLEGLIVGIQVLRLEYYELFSRFYKGNGREFVSYKENR